ncbi:MAG: 50S ribosomal protein L6 [Planctomycetaceae bacterium]|jgi:large subunit ribosomal protein L6|nr:50S ribosomal protein L6 [Planctomycetaceae bacterium]
MSRIGNKAVSILDGVKVNLQGREIEVTGPQGTLRYTLRPEVSVEVDADGKSLQVRAIEGRTARAFHGLTRALINNMIIGVKSGYEKKLELQGVGYVCSLKGDELTLRVGFANELKKKVPAGLSVTCPDQTHVLVKGCDKQAVGEFAAAVRALRKPEPYKGKGIRYQGEVIKLKAGKSAKS